VSEDESSSKYSGLSERDKVMLRPAGDSGITQPEQPEDESDEQLADQHIFNIEFDDGSSIEIPYREKVVKFDQGFIEKTAGVEGYTRRSIEWSNLISILEGILPSSELVKFAEGNPRSDGSEYQLDFSGETTYSPNNLHSVLSLIDSMNISEEYKERAGKIKHILHAVLDKLAPGFLTNCYVHQMNLHVHDRKEFPIGAFKTQLLTMRIASPEVISRGENMDLNTSMRWSIGLNYQIRELSSDKIIGGGNPAQVAEQLGFQFDEGDPDDFLKQVAQHGYYLQSVNLSVMNGGIWVGANYRSTDSAMLFNHVYPTFAFSRKNTAFVRYLNAFIKNTDHRRFSKKERLWGRYLAELDPDIRQGPDEQYSEEHPFIPTILAHPDIPEPRWCHSTYAYIPTSKNLNICEMISSQQEENSDERME